MEMGRTSFESRPVLPKRMAPASEVFPLYHRFNERLPDIANKKMIFCTNMRICPSQSASFVPRQPVSNDAIQRLFVALLVFEAAQRSA